ncbi:MAG: ATP-binding protein [Proteobacteria bacterium]|nr:ATP-binding protein [Pseudomonadota bacterium]
MFESELDQGDISQTSVVRNICMIFSSKYIAEKIHSIAPQFKVAFSSHEDAAKDIDVATCDLCIIELRVADFFSDLDLAKSLLVARPMLPIFAMSRNDNLDLKVMSFHAGVMEFQSPDADIQEILARAESLARLGKATRVVEIQNVELLKTMNDISALEKEKSQNQATLMHNSKMASLGEMAGNLAHEINNPLGILNGRILQMRKILTAETPAKQEALDVLEKMTAVSKRIASITKGLKSFSRMGEADPFEEISIQTLVEDTLAFCAEGIRQLGIELRICEVDPKLRISGRPTQVSQVLLNLLSNARDAAETYAEKWVSINIESDDKFVCLMITDSGPGLPEHLIQKIYEPFFTTKPVNKGTGLGLPISKKILEEHGGELTIDRACPNTRFVVVIPKLPG